ncbi:interleukin-18 isoform X2 [Macrotis lagotis]|uniref:interleukin-18 isoform X2 n=1 Tax=Macrotis lagotis TaxID=92651 RepID=UPI003D698FEF
MVQIWFEKPEFFLNGCDNLQSDNFQKFEDPRNAILRNLNNQVLMKSNEMNIPVLEDMTDHEIQANAHQTILMMQAYKETVPKSLAMAILVNGKKQIYSLSCQNHELQFKEGPPPNHIAAETSEFIFYQHKVPGHKKMQFESSLYPGYFLACKKEEKGDFKLVLKQDCQEVDTFMMFTVQYC